MIRNVFSFLGLMFIFVCTTCIPKAEYSTKLTSADSRPSLIDTAFNKLWHYKLNEELSFNQCPGMAIAIIKDGQVIYEQQYGSKSAYNQVDIDSLSMFRIGSVSKGFAGVLAGILIDKGYFSLEDSICTYVPELSMRAKSKDHVVRVKHVLSHSSGLTEHAFSNLVDENHSMATIIANLNRISPRDSTGKKYAYQNAAFGLIERVIENVTGMGYAKALDHFIFGPLGMNKSTVTYDQMVSETNACSGHKYGGKRAGFIQIPCSPHYYNVPSAGGVNSNLADMKRWLRAVMGEKTSINRHAFEIAFSPQINTSNDDKYFNHWPGFIHSHYGLGWRLIKTSIGDYVYHGGLVNGFRSEIAYDKNQNLGIIVLFNSTCAYSNRVVPDFFELWHNFHLPVSTQENI
jgi:beta-lactamase class C